ncbi:MAG: OB-fold domain-containing protein [Desulfobacterales bacterium]
MIAYLEGTLLKKEEDRIILLANQVGYEVLLPMFVMETIQAKKVGEAVSFFIYHYQTERQPRPALIGFHLEAEREFLNCLFPWKPSARSRPSKPSIFRSKTLPGPLNPETLSF